jgi:hypothetical protein
MRFDRRLLDEVIVTPPSMPAPGQKGAFESDVPFGSPEANPT